MARPPKLLQRKLFHPACSSPFPPQPSLRSHQRQEICGTGSAYTGHRQLGRKPLRSCGAGNQPTSRKRAKDTAGKKPPAADSRGENVEQLWLPFSRDRKIQGEKHGLCSIARVRPACSFSCQRSQNSARTSPCRVLWHPRFYLATNGREARQSMACSVSSMILRRSKLDHPLPLVDKPPEPDVSQNCAMACWEELFRFQGSTSPPPPATLKPLMQPLPRLLGGRGLNKSFQNTRSRKAPSHLKSVPLWF